MSVISPVRFIFKISPKNIYFLSVSCIPKPVSPWQRLPLIQDSTASHMLLLHGLPEELRSQRTGKANLMRSLRVRVADAQSANDVALLPG